MDDTAELLIAFAKVLMMVGGLCAIGIAVGIPAARWMGNRLGALLSGLSDERFDEREPLLGPPAAMAVRGDLEGALVAYDALRDRYPKEPEIYWRMMEILLGPLRDEARARSLLDLALLNLDDGQQKESLLELVEDLRKNHYLPFGYLLGKDARSCGSKAASGHPAEPPPLKIASPS